jgi:transposase-like protein
VPRDREGRFRTELFGRYQRSEKALVLALMEMVELSP